MSIEIVSKIYSDIEDDKILNAVMSCLKLARIHNDYLNAAIFLRELSSDNKYFNNHFYDLTIELNKEARNFLHKTSLQHWLEERTIPDNNDSLEDKQVYDKGVGDLLTSIEQDHKMISEIRTPQGMSAYDTAYFEDRNTNTRIFLRNRISDFTIIKERIRARCWNYALEFEKQINEQSQNQNFFFNIQSDVNNYFKSKDHETYSKLLRASELINSNNKEDHSLLLTEIRRALKSLADFLCPPKEGLTLCTDGEQRKLSSDKFLNRIREYLAARMKVDTYTELSKAEFESFSIRIVKLNDLACKGVHNDVFHHEAKQALLSLYLFLYNIIQLETYKKSPSAINN